MSTISPAGPRALLAVLLLLATGCVTTAPEPRAPSPREALVGRWVMAQMFDQGVDISADQNPDGDRAITLAANGTFVSSGGPSGRNTGRWRYEAANHLLVLESDLGGDNDSRWIVTLRGNDVMEWGGIGSDFARRFRIVSRRAR